jgi:hypothetical protein
MVGRPFLRLGEKRNSHKILVGKIIEKRSVKIRRNTRKDNIKYDENSITLGYETVQIGKKLQKTWIFINVVLRTSDIALKSDIRKIGYKYGNGWKWAKDVANGASIWEVLQLRVLPQVSWSSSLCTTNICCITLPCCILQSRGLRDWNLGYRI